MGTDRRASIGRRHRSRCGAGWLAFLIVAAALVLPIAAAARPPKPQPCPPGRFLVSGEPIIAGAALAVDVIVIGSIATIASGCGPVRAKLKATRQGTRVSARWKQCGTLRGPATFAGIIRNACSELAGTFRARKAKQRTTVVATRSRCGDGVVDAGANETCDDTTGCGAGRCTDGCTCEVGRDCAGNGAPSASLTIGPTGTASVPVTFDGTASSDPDGDALAYSWDFGDDTRGGTPRLAHRYTAAGSFTATLTVGDGCTTASAERQVTITPGPTSEGTAAASGIVRAAGSGGLGGVSVSAAGGGSGTTGNDGKVSLSVPVGVSFLVTLEKAGYATQRLPLTVPSGSSDAYFEATVLPREAPLSVDAATGGAAGGKDGATLVLPPNALLHLDGTPASGTVQVSMTPVDPVTNPEAFPGRYAGVTASGQEGLLFSYGTVEFDLRQGGVPVNLAPGSTATVELPLYATLTKTGATVGIGATIPLWSLDERTGTWMQEGEGAVVASAGSPSGLALRAPVSHLSWWNCDAFDFPPYKPKPKCLVDTNADGILEDLTGTGHCWNAGTGPEQPLVRAGARADFPRRLPRFAAQVMIPAAGGVVLPVPADVDVTFRASAKNGTLVGQKVVHGPGDLEEDVIIVLEPLAIDDAVPVSIPWDQTYRIAVAGEVDQYRFEATAGMPVYVTVSRAPRSNLVGTILIQGPNGFEMGPTAFSANGINGTPAAVAFFAPASGRYRILVDGTANEPNGYRLVLAATGGIPLLVSTSPPAGATGLSTALSAVTATFNQALDPSSVTSENFRLDDIISRGGAYPLATTASAADAVASVMPAAALAPGIPYTATLTTGILSAAGDPLQSSYRWSFTTADVAGGTYRVGRGYRTSFAMGPGGESYVAFASDRVNAVPAGVVVARHVPGEGWTPTLLRPSVEGGIDSDTSVATSADGTAMVVFVQMNGGGASGVWASRHPPAGAWSALEELAAPSSDLRSKSVPPIVRMDAAGNAWAVWRRGNALDARRWTPAAGWGATEVVAEVHTAFFRFDLAVGRMGHTAVAWYDPNTGLASVRRFDPVVGWAAIEPLSESGPVFAAHVGVDDGGNVMALWRQHGVVNWRRYSVDDGAWTAPALLINDGLGSSTVCSYSTQLAVLPAGNALMLGCSGSFVFTARYDAGAGTWSAPDTGFFAGGLTFLALAANPAGDAVAAWSHAASGPPEINRVYWRRHSAAAGAWDATPTPVPQVNFSHTEQLHAAITPSGAAAVQYREAPDGNSRVVMVTRLP